MFKFINPEGQETLYEERVVEIKKDVSPIKEIISKNDFSSFSISLNEQVVSLENSFQLQVNVKEVGIFRFIFNKDGFEKDEIINRISLLKERVVVDTQSARDKVTVLLDIVDRPYLLFMIYEPFDMSYINTDYFTTFMTKNIQTFLLKEEKEVRFYEVSVGHDEIEQSQKKKKSQGENRPRKKKGAKQFFKAIADKKFHFLLLVVSTTLFEVSVPLAIVNVYGANPIYIFLFICAVIGVGMDGYSYYDLFKTESPKSQISLASYLANLIGIGIGIGLFALFYNLSEKPENVPAIGNMIVIGLLVCIIVCAAIIGITYFIRKGNKKPKSSD